MRIKKPTFRCLIIAIFLLIILPSCNRYGAPSANNQVDYVGITNPMEAKIKKKEKYTYNEYTGLYQNSRGKAQSKRKTKKQAKKRQKVKKKKKVKRKNL